MCITRGIPNRHYPTSGEPIVAIIVYSVTFPPVASRVSNFLLVAPSAPSRIIFSAQTGSVRKPVSGIIICVWYPSFVTGTRRTSHQVIFLLMQESQGQMAWQFDMSLVLIKKIIFPYLPLHMITTTTKLG